MDYTNMQAKREVWCRWLTGFVAGAMAMAVFAGESQKFQAESRNDPLASSIAIGDLHGQCDDRRCHGELPVTVEPLEACQGVSSVVGELVSFSVGSRKLDPADLDKCNRAAAHRHIATIGQSVEDAGSGDLSRGVVTHGAVTAPATGAAGGLQQGAVTHGRVEAEQSAPRLAPAAFDIRVLLRRTQQLAPPKTVAPRVAPSGFDLRVLLRRTQQAAPPKTLAPRVAPEGFDINITLRREGAAVQ